MSDTIQRFTFAKLPIRGEIITLDDSFKTIVEQHQYPAAQRQLLGQALAASALMAEIIKIKGKIALQLQSPSTVKILLAECTHQGHIRGLVNIDEGQSSKQKQAELNFSDWTQGGQMAITIEPEQGQRYQGVVPLESTQLSSCLEDYFNRSEQLPTYIQLFVEDDKAFGLFLQALPNHASSADLLSDPSHETLSTEEKTQAFEHVTALADTLTSKEAFSVNHQELLYRLFHQDEVTLFSEKPIRFQCSCSRQRNEKALTTIAPDELISMVKDNGGQLELVCDFCSKQEIFTEQDIMDFLSTADISDSIN